MCAMLFACLSLGCAGLSLTACRNVSVWNMCVCLCDRVNRFEVFCDSLFECNK